MGVHGGPWTTMDPHGPLWPTMAHHRDRYETSTDGPTMQSFWSFGLLVHSTLLVDWLINLLVYWSIPLYLVYLVYLVYAIALNRTLSILKCAAVRSKNL